MGRRFIFVSLMFSDVYFDLFDEAFIVPGWVNAWYCIFKWKYARLLLGCSNATAYLTLILHNAIDARCSDILCRSSTCGAREKF